MPGHPKLEILKYLFNRPTVMPAFGEVCVAVLRYLEEEDNENPKQTLEYAVIGAIKEHMAEKGKDTT